jgi:hypothetical protein
VHALLKRRHPALARADLADHAGPDRGPVEAAVDSAVDAFRRTVGEEDARSRLAPVVRTDLIGAGF